METLTLQRSNSARIAGSLRVATFIAGMILLLLTYSSFFGEGGTFWTGFFFAIGIGLILAAIFNITIGNANKLILNSDFIRIEESGSYIRTAYWNKVDTLRLSRYSIRIKYKSGTPERFSLPLFGDDQHTELMQWLRQKCEAQDIQFSEKAWWKPF